MFKYPDQVAAFWHRSGHVGETTGAGAIAGDVAEGGHRVVLNEVSNRMILPRESRRSTADGVAKLVAGEIRRTCNIPILDKKGRPTGQHSVDVLHRPIENDPKEPDNLAHCQIECQPAIDNDNRFKRLKEALAAIANQYGWVVEPGSA